ncbi:hypothetical protein Pint_24066 [Pistacia integerrima]|uniref:Uncharacterized protein n=1 Tax=Pistacia integerrima TaxID=434235 RepID=A0ACC0YJU9_9ROSI|nr:hypothetical protein Pint_24066 [Pistacia integerrima]
MVSVLCRHSKAKGKSATSPSHASNRDLFDMRIPRRPAASAIRFFASFDMQLLSE